MTQANIANYVVFDTAEKFNCTEPDQIEKEIVDIIADNWAKKHFVTTVRDRRFHHDKQSKQSFII